MYFCAAKYELKKQLVIIFRLLSVFGFLINFQITSEFWLEYNIMLYFHKQGKFIYTFTYTLDNNFESRQITDHK